MRGRAAAPQRGRAHRIEHGDGGDAERREGKQRSAQAERADDEGGAEEGEEEGQQVGDLAERAHERRHSLRRLPDRPVRADNAENVRTIEIGAIMVMRCGSDTDCCSLRQPLRSLARSLATTGCSAQTCRLPCSRGRTPEATRTTTTTTPAATAAACPTAPATITHRVNVFRKVLHLVVQHRDLHHEDAADRRDAHDVRVAVVAGRAQQGAARRSKAQQGAAGRSTAQQSKQGDATDA